MWFALYIGVFVAALLMPLWFFALCAFCYALFRPGYELILIGVLVDAQFGTASPGFPYMYTAATVLIVFGLIFLKPHLSFYIDNTD